jgi:hypothetical protein
MTCGDFHDGSEKGTASVYKNLCQSWEKCYGDPHNDSTSIRGPNLELYAGVSMACPVHARFMPGRILADDNEPTGRLTSCTTPETIAQIQEPVIPCRQDQQQACKHPGSHRTHAAQLRHHKCHVEATG